MREDGTYQELGRGAMGVTYKAFDTNLRIPVALKVINATFINSEVARQRFVREARAAAALRHPNVASVFHLAIYGDAYFYAMEFVDGETLESLIRRSGPIAPTLALQITIQVARALAAASKLSLVHRDIKPANLMILHQDEELVVKVIDFGLAKSFGAEAEDLATVSMGGFVGTPHFASPEQLEERDLDVRSDIYSLGITLWYMLAGRTPFGGTLAQVMSQHLSKPPPFEQLEMPSAMAALLKRMLAKEAGERFQTPTELRKAAEQCADSLKGISLAPPQGAADPEDFATVAEDAMATQAAPAPIEKPQPPSIPSVPSLASMPSPAKSSRRLWIVGGLLAAIAAGGAALLLPETPAPQPEASKQTASLAQPTPAIPPPTPAPIAAPAPTPTPTPAIVAATPQPTPFVRPTPSRQDLLKERLAATEKIEAAKDWSRALREYLQLAQDYPESSQAVRNRLESIILELGPQLEKTGDAAFEEIRADLASAARLDVVSAMMLLGRTLNKREPAVAYSWFQSAAAKGYAPAITQEALMLSNGRGVPQDLPKAFSLFEQAADKGDPAAKTCLGECYLYGTGTPKAFDKAIAMLRESADAGEPRGMNLLGTCYQQGTGTDKNFEEAMRLFIKAAEAGFPDALGNQGVLYMNGQGVATDEKRAAELFQKGARLGSVSSMFFLGRCYESGVGLGKSLSEAQSWYLQAAKGGHPGAAKWCKENGVE